MSIAPQGGGGGGAPIVTTGTFFVDAAAAAGGDGSRAAPYDDLQNACNAAYQANQITPGAIGSILVLPGVYLTRSDAPALPFSNGSVEIDNFTVRSTGGAAATTIIGSTGLSLNCVVLRENGLLDGFTLVPEPASLCLTFADSGSGTVGRRSVARNIIFDAEPLNPVLGGACVAQSQTASGQARDNALESFEVRGEWDSGIAFNQDGGILYIRDGIIDRACRFDFSVFYAGGVAFVQNVPARLYVENVHIPPEVTITDDAFVVNDDGELYLHDVSVESAGNHGLSGLGTGKFFGDGISSTSSGGNDINLAGASKITASSIIAVSESFASAGAINALPDRSGTAIVLNTTAAIVVALGIAFDGKRVTATMAEADGAITVANATWDGAGNLTIRTTAAVTADRDVSYVVHTSTI